MPQCKRHRLGHSSRRKCPNALRALGVHEREIFAISQSLELGLPLIARVLRLSVRLPCRDSRIAGPCVSLSGLFCTDLSCSCVRLAPACGALPDVGNDAAFRKTALERPAAIGLRLRGFQCFRRFARRRDSDSVLAPASTPEYADARRRYNWAANRSLSRACVRGAESPQTRR